MRIRKPIAAYQVSFGPSEWQKLENASGRPLNPELRLAIEKACATCREVDALYSASVRFSAVRPILKRLAGLVPPLEADRKVEAVEHLIRRTAVTSGDYISGDLRLRELSRFARIVLDANAKTKDKGPPSKPGQGELMIAAEDVFKRAGGDGKRRHLFLGALCDLMGIAKPAPASVTRIADKEKRRRETNKKKSPT